MKMGITTVLLLFFAAWIAIADGPEERMARSCKPVVWTGNLTVSLTLLMFPKYQDSVQTAFDKFDYGCRYSLWRLFYEREYLKQLELEKNGGTGGVGGA